MTIGRVIDEVAQRFLASPWFALEALIAVLVG